MYLSLSGFILLATTATVSASPSSFPDTESQKSSRLAVINGLLTARAAQATACGPVSGANVKGECYNINTTCCLGFYSTGYCPGGSNIQCCTYLQQCGSGGWCNDINHVSCSKPYQSGLCPGPNNVRCCTGSSGDTKCTAGH